MIRHPGPPELPGSYLVLELTRGCNLDCVHCDRPSSPGQPASPAFLDISLVRDLLQDLARFGARFDSLVLFWLGEPLLHPHFPGIYQAVLRANERHRVFGKVEVHTNATLLGDELARVALNEASTPQVWHLTIDAAAGDTWGDIKRRSMFKEVERNVRALVKRKGSMGAPWPRLVTQFIVSDRNAAEAGRFKMCWERAFWSAGLPVVVAAGHVPEGREDVVFLRQLDCPTSQEQSRQNTVFRAVAADLGLALPAEDRAPALVEDVNRVPCSGFWKSPVVRWDGVVTVCTRDSEARMAFGDLRERSFSSIWWGPDLEAARRRVAEGDYGGLPLCGGCFIPRSMNYSNISAEECRRHRDWAAARRRVGSLS